jgi:hypothetical protein
MVEGLEARYSLPDYIEEVLLLGLGDVAYPLPYSIV